MKEDVFFCVPQKKESHPGLKQQEGKKIMMEFSFFSELYL